MAGFFISNTAAGRAHRRKNGFISQPTTFEYSAYNFHSTRVRQEVLAKFPANFELFF